MELAQVVDKQDCNVLFVRKILGQADVLIIICVQIVVAARSPNALQGINHNEFCVRMLRQKLLDLLFQPVLERVGHDRKVQSRRGIFRQVKESRLDTLERIFKAEIPRFSLRCCKIPECLSLRNAQAKPQGQPRLADFRRTRENMQASGMSSSTRKCVGSYVRFCRSSALMVSSLVIFSLPFDFIYYRYILYKSTIE